MLTNGIRVLVDVVCVVTDGAVEQGVLSLEDTVVVDIRLLFRIMGAFQMSHEL